MAMSPGEFMVYRNRVIPQLGKRAAKSPNPTDLAAKLLKSKPALSVTQANELATLGFRMLKAIGLIPQDATGKHPPNILIPKLGNRG